MTDSRLQQATVQALLMERRQNINEARHEPDETAKEMLLFHVAEIDVELERRRCTKKR